MTEQPVERTTASGPPASDMPPSDPLPDVAPAAATPAATPAASAATSAANPAAKDVPVDPADSSLLNLIDRLAAMLDRTELTELEVQVGSTGLVLRKPSAVAPVTVAGPAPVAPADGAAVAAAPADAAPIRPAVRAPLSGIWYGSPTPGSAPYISVGGEVAVGQVIGLIEAMKLFNEIKSDLAGRVVKITADNGKLVRAKQPLIEVEPL
jgi:acetyl-CoA carboxylase biotin carboxyl carrier protein